MGVKFRLKNLLKSAKSGEVNFFRCEPQFYLFKHLSKMYTFLTTFNFIKNRSIEYRCKTNWPN